MRNAGVRFHLPSGLLPAGAPPARVQITICDYQDPICDDYTGDVLHTKHYLNDEGKTYVDLNYATLLEEIDTKLVAFTRAQPTDTSCTLMYFARNPSASGHVGR